MRGKGGTKVRGETWLGEEAPVVFVLSYSALLLDAASPAWPLSLCLGRATTRLRFLAGVAVGAIPETRVAWAGAGMQVIHRRGRLGPCNRRLLRPAYDTRLDPTASLESCDNLAADSSP
jgi:hypothetical protein